MAEFTVVWDGRRGGPGGAQLFAPEGETRQAQPVHRVRHGLRDEVIAALEKGPATGRQLHFATRYPEEAIHAEMRRLRVEGRVTITGFAAFRRQIYTLVRP